MRARKWRLCISIGRPPIVDWPAPSASLAMPFSARRMLIIEKLLGEGDKERESVGELDGVSVCVAETVVL